MVARTISKLRLRLQGLVGVARFGPQAGKADIIADGLDQSGRKLPSTYPTLHESLYAPSKTKYFTENF
jgi:hypothetical protein